MMASMPTHSPDLMARTQFLQATALHRQGKIEEAETLYREILARVPDFPDALQMLGVVAALKGRLDDAEDLITRAIAINPRYAGYQYNLAKVLEARGDDNRAEHAYRQAIRLEPGNSASWLNLSNLMLRKPDYAAVAKLASEAQRLKPESVPALNNLGIALAHLPDHEIEAERALRYALKLEPGRAETLVNLARLLSQQDRYSEATPLLRRAVELAPGMAEAYNNLASTLKFEGKIEEALTCSRKALELKPSAPGHSNLLFNLNYFPSISPEELFREHVAWADRHAGSLGKKVWRHGNDRSPDRILRIGYLSPDFRGHPVATFMQGIVAEHDRTRFEVICYANVSKKDQTTAWFQAHCDHWNDVTGMSEEILAERIRADGIDILIELAGHTSSNRLLTMARKPAPVQASYLGYLGTTAIDAIDYKITDAVINPPGMTEAFYTEKLIRLPHGMWCYTPPPDAPGVAPPPVAKRGHVTFASFNNSAKVTGEVVKVWADILHRVPDAHLLMLTKGDGRIHDYYHDEFARHGISKDRLDLRAGVPFMEFLALHSEADIALDPFPYTGGTTTCHSLWMGVPVLTLRGDRPFSRSSASILTTLDMTDWITASIPEYVETALSFAKDSSGLRTLRETLRARMQAATLTDAAGFTRSLETAYREMWRTWLNSPPPCL